MSTVTSRLRSSTPLMPLVSISGLLSKVLRWLDDAGYSVASPSSSPLVTVSADRIDITDARFFDRIGLLARLRLRRT